MVKNRPRPCEDDAWEEGIDGWVEKGYGENLTTWWASIIAKKPTANFTDEIRLKFGPSQLTCGIGSGVGCTYPDCKGMCQAPSLKVH